MYHIFPYNRPLPINYPLPLLSTFVKFIFRGFTFLSLANTFAILGFKKNAFLVLLLLNTKRKSEQNMAVLITLKSAKKYEIKLYNFFRFKVCFEYFKLSRHYTCWQASSRREVSINAHCHWTRELIFFIRNSRPPFLKNAYRPHGVYMNNPIHDTISQSASWACLFF